MNDEIESELRPRLAGTLEISVPPTFAGTLQLCGSAVKTFRHLAFETENLV